MTTPEETPPRALVVRRLSNREEIHRVDITGRTERDVDRVLTGLLRRIDTEEFFVDDTSINPD